MKQPFLDLRYQVESSELLHALTRQHGRTVVVVLHDLQPSPSTMAIPRLVFYAGAKSRVLHEGDVCTPELIKAVFDVDVIYG